MLHWVQIDYGDYAKITISAIYRAYDKSCAACPVHVEVVGAPSPHLSPNII